MMGHAPDPTNSYRYAGNDPVDEKDPTGLFKVKTGRPVAVGALGLSIDPTNGAANLDGGNFSLEWQEGDGDVLVQRVTSEGAFSVTDDCGLTHSVRWTESYHEAWTKFSSRDEHKARPGGPAEYLETKGGWNFQLRGNELYLVKGAERRSVEGWTFHMTARFEMVNGNYPGRELAPFDFISGAHMFEITNLTINNNTISNPRPNAVFGAMLFRADASQLLPGLPPVQLGAPQIANDSWDIQWVRGQSRPTSNYKTSEYQEAK
jgi:hypothetical protein